MNHSMISASVSMRSIQQRIDLISQNVANVNTAGYKRKEASFQDVLALRQQQHEDFELPGRHTPMGLTLGGGSILTGLRQDLSQGALQETGRALDVALEGNAMIEISEWRTDEAGEQVLDRIWTRQGAFQLSPVPDSEEGSFYLTTSQGRQVLDVNDQPIVIPRDRNIQIDDNGSIYAVHPTNPSDQALIGQLKTVQVIRPDLIEQIGSNQFIVKPEVENIEDVIVDIDLTEPRTPETAGVHYRQGFIEQSNVDLTTEMTNLITAQRALQFNARAIASTDQMMDMTNRLRG